MCNNSYGTALRAFIAKYCEGSEQNQEILLKKIDEFVSLNVSSDASGQVRRVARKFGLIATAGEAAIEWGILPFSKGEAYASAQRWFKIWLEQRGGSGDLEMAKVLKRIQDHFALNQSQYVRWDRHADFIVQQACVKAKLVNWLPWSAVKIFDVPCIYKENKTLLAQ